MDTASMDVTPEPFISNHVPTLGALGLIAMLLLLSSTLNNPLSQVPGPWYTRFTDVVGRLHWVAGSKAPYIHNLHHKYGCQEHFQDQNEFPKSRWYLDFAPFIVDVFNTPDIPTHRRFRRLLSAPLSESGLKDFLPQIENKVNLSIQGMAEEYKTRGAADIYKWWLYLTTDVIGELSFGESFRMLETKKTSQYIIDLQNVGKFGSYQSAFPSLFRFSYRHGIPLPMSSGAQASFQRMRTYGSESISRHSAIVEREGPDSRPTVFTKLYKAKDEANITQDEIQDHALTYIVAGSDTTSNTLTYLVWAVSRDPEVKSRLVKELGVLPDDFTYEELQQAHILYLEHVIDETLRRYPVAPSGLPREVPQGGAELCGYHIPAGYTVATQNYSLHQDPNAFPNPEKFDPSRWENTTPAMKDAFMPFGGGSRVCIGLHLARIELRLGAARFFKRFPNAKMSSLEGMTEEDMIPKLFFLIHPQRHRCLMELE
ncbi:hypothetical protein RRF57_009400 [Xylaria bambusicola]|uniref:Cytochrome P450 n=1 Tax=Xylaria bambusicola TaxID=326684 RepID=A0AAN7UWR9_9PEZI